MTISLNSLKTQIKSVLDTANTTTATFDLSAGLNTRIQKVLKVNPAMISPQSSFFPWVTIFIDRKDVEHLTIAKDQLTAKRRATVGVNIVGAVWEPTITDVVEDEADENIEIMMENIEEVIRRNFKLNNTANWTKAENVEYHSFPIQEQTHMRVGVLKLNCKIDY